jgi:hypothetical protein
MSGVFIGIVDGMGKVGETSRDLLRPLHRHGSQSGWGDSRDPDVLA